ncbi:MAG: glycosyltransferase [Armatimonadota bacterium]|nr:glycosyltransferase [Armatimonadota bacterium]
MTITATVCTRDRPALIADCLAALSANTFPGLEILVVDQSSDTATEDAVTRAARRDGRIRCLRGSSASLSRARNIGVRESVGDVVAFTDDDCVPQADWAAKLAVEFSADLRISAVFGRSLPDRPAEPEERLVGVKTSPRRRVFSGKCNPWLVGHGNNMAFRRGVFDKVGFFDEMLGPGAALRNCDDADFTYRVLRAGFAVLYSPEPLVYHRQFRHGKDLQALEKDYGIGAGAIYSKRLRSRDVYALRLMLDRWSRYGLMHIAYGVVTGRPLHVRLGWYRIAYSLAGMWAARRFRVDRSRGVFLGEQ